jgi:hypothetical protein
LHSCAPAFAGFFHLQNIDEHSAVGEEHSTAAEKSESCNTNNEAHLEKALTYLYAVKTLISFL